MTKKGTTILLTALFLSFFFVFVPGREKSRSRENTVSNLSKKPVYPLVKDTLKTGIKSYNFHYKNAVVSETIEKRVDINIVESLQNRDKNKISDNQNDEIYFYQNYPLIKSSNPVIFQITFDNDIFDETDYYYTNGIRFSLITPAAKRVLLNKLLIGDRTSDIVLSGFSLRQNMYTATNPETPVILKGDHPFAGYLVFGHFLQTVDFDKRLSIFSEINLGVIGPASLAASIQRGVHEKYPAGWDYQISNDLIINYTLRLEKSLISNKNIELNATSRLNTGTLYDDLSAGMFFRTGYFTPVYKGIPLSENKKLHYWFFVKSNLKGVMYNATLQGGMFNDSPYTIAKDDINRLVFTASAGLAFYYNSLGLELENFYQTPEFKGAMSFKWGRINLILRF